MIGCGPTWRINGPPPARRSLGLLQAADGGNTLVRRNPSGVVDGAGVPRWLSGVEVWPSLPGLAQTWDGGGSPAATKSAGDDPADWPQFGPFAVYFAETCSTFGNADDAAFRQRALDALAATEGYAIEHELLTGTLRPLDPHLADADTEILNSGGGSTSVSNALALLENAIAATGKQGVIHCSPAFVTKASEHGVVFERTLGALRTINDTLVIPGAGYADPGPAGTPGGEADPAATEEWVYATNGIDVFTTPAEVLPGTVAEALDRENNEITYRVEEYVLVAYDNTFKAAVLADRCQTNC